MVCYLFAMYVKFLGGKVIYRYVGGKNQSFTELNGSLTIVVTVVHLLNIKRYSPCFTNQNDPELVSLVRNIKAHHNMQK